MIKVKLFLSGIKKKRKFIIVVSNSKSSRNGKFIEKIGFYDPINKILKLNTNKLLYWKKNGAKLNNSVKKIDKIYKKKCFY
ncbi:30S ribosomal protein S16p [Candidatus Nasuia deltocephalinicola]|nr:30S ribosomal protein S16p [Candidatus Nasuia deltocephalinicola]